MMNDKVNCQLVNLGKAGRCMPLHLPSFDNNLEEIIIKAWCRLVVREYMLHYILVFAYSLILLSLYYYSV